MKCESCGAATSPTNKFCPQCGAKISIVEQPVNEIDLTWISNALIQAGYEAEASGDLVIAYREGGAKILVGKVDAPALITMQIRWTMSGVSFTNRRAFTDAVNKSNQANWLCTFYHTDDYKTLSSSSSMFLPASMAAPVLANYVDMFSQLTHSAMTTADLFRFG